MTRIAAFGFAGLAILASTPLLRAAERKGEDATQRMLDAMTRNDLCARDDAGLRRLNRSLSGHPRQPQARSH